MYIYIYIYIYVYTRIYNLSLSLSTHIYIYIYTHTYVVYICLRNGAIDGTRLTLTSTQERLDGTTCRTLLVQYDLILFSTALLV